MSHGGPLGRGRRDDDAMALFEIVYEAFYGYAFEASLFNAFTVPGDQEAGQ
jgi:hypothetical protein